ncbi:prepilin-type N-terminal cleavage/methylation domain-containing protein, partial [Campylobacter coli]|nr:prepilin-type N-terminal cleavage/methylation domain-containing protein [Campylobacter coli]EAL7257252.1 prepilin-type N-terminal cleavage/methylation domain-containing protein [Campylobacter coli]EAL9745526.1 prepilin-type N-terminal cleavage/methylation domain-containing protein [Campylobacter coli]ECZ0393181.1 prepilin-type N-terminal cleavage/methylation domain-containing protein [Campylobacter coli]EIL5346983.1 prepilin-type N-terminal cleavage/methylation domain-containing protein [Cam
MNKAFSLFETILVLILIGFLALFLSRTLWEFY